MSPLYELKSITIPETPIHRNIKKPLHSPRIIPENLKPRHSPRTITQNNPEKSHPSAEPAVSHNKFIPAYCVSENNGTDLQLLTYEGLANLQKVKVDCGANANFISEKTRKKYNFTTKPNKGFTIIYGDGSNELCNSEVEVEIEIDEYQDTINLNVANIANFDIILGKEWLKKHNPTVDWCTNNIKFNFNGRVINFCPRKHDQDESNIITALQTKKSATKQHVSTFLLLVQEACADRTSTKSDPEVQSLLESFADIFPKELPIGLPPARGAAHRIVTIPGSSPPNKPPYRLSASDLEEVTKQVGELLNKGFIQPSTSPFGAPVILVNKKDGKKRMCIDYRALNKQTIKNRFPLPLIDDLFDALKDAKYFSKIDLNSGFNQIPIAPEDVEKTAFRTRFAHYEYLVMPFGLTNAPATFMNMMTNVFKKLMFKCVVVFLDDILIYSNSKEQHIKDIELVLRTLRANKLYAKMEKCEFLKRTVDYLGHTVTSDGISPQRHKLFAIKNWPVPKSVSNVRSFLGLASYYRKYIKNFAHISSPMNELLKTKKKFIWSSSQSDSFNALKEALVSAPVLQIADPKRTYWVTTDASDVAIGAVLEQEDENNNIHPVAYESRTLTPAESNYPVHERELLAIVHALKKWRVYLAAETFNVVTDHYPLNFLHSQKALSPRQTRWSLDLAEFNYKIIYRPGKQNVVADALSRAHIQSMSTLSGCATFLQSIRDGYPSDESLRTIIDDLENEKEVENYTMRSSLLFFRNKLCIPSSVNKRDIIREAHATPITGHLGVDKTTKLLKKHFSWNSLADDVKTFIKNCDSCQRIKAVNKAPSGALQPISVPNTRWQQISMDFITHLPLTKQGFDAILVVIDSLTKQIHLIATKTTFCAKDIARQFFDTIFRYHGIPLKIISDRDPKFMSAFWRSLFKMLGTQLAPSTAYHPQTDGLTERANRTVQEMLRVFIQGCDETEWDKLLTPVEFAYNNSVQGSTNISPFKLDTGQDPITPQSLLGDCAAQSPNPAANNFLSEINRNIKMASENIVKAQQRQKKYADKRRSEADFEIGDQVLLSTKNLKLPQHKTPKFQPRYIGPFKVVSKINSVAYTLCLPDDFKIHPTFHVSLLKRYYNQDNELPLNTGTPTTIPEQGTENIIGHRRTDTGDELLIQPPGGTIDDATWQSTDKRRFPRGLINKEFYPRR